MSKQDILKLIASLVICQMAGVIGSLFTTPAIPIWYAALKKPAFNPPNWVFAPVWMTLFIMMGVAAFLVWRKGLETPQIKLAMGVFLFQLLLNTLWSVAFFGLQSPLLGVIEIGLLWAAIAVTLVLFWKISIAAGILLAPYLGWVSFAAVLNIALWRLNRF